MNEKLQDIKNQINGIYELRKIGVSNAHLINKAERLLQENQSLYYNVSLENNKEIELFNNNNLNLLSIIRSIENNF